MSSHKLSECCNEQCKRKQNCKRYTEIKEDCNVSFDKICSEESFKYFVQKDKEEVAING